MIQTLKKRQLKASDNNTDFIAQICIYLNNNNNFTVFGAPLSESDIKPFLTAFLLGYNTYNRTDQKKYNDFTINTTT